MIHSQDWAPRAEAQQINDRDYIFPFNWELNIFSATQKWIYNFEQATLCKNKIPSNTALKLFPEKL